MNLHEQEEEKDDHPGGGARSPGGAKGETAVMRRIEVAKEGDRKRYGSEGSVSFAIKPKSKSQISFLSSG